MNIEEPALFRLMAWLSPSFPVGAFSYSHGLEWLIESGAVRGEADLRAWVQDVLQFGSGRTDAILFAHAWHAATSGDKNTLSEIGALAVALAPSAERHLETIAQGNAFCDMLHAAWPAATLAVLRGADEAVAYPVAVAVASADHGIPLDAALPAYLHACAANLISAGMRLIPLGQTAGQRITASIESAVASVAEEALIAPLDEIGSALMFTDIASMHHETQYTRLFRS